MTANEIEVRPVREEDIESLHACMDSIAKERIYLERFEAHPLDAMKEFLLDRISDGSPYFVAVEDGKVVGWCNVFPLPQEIYQHRGTLGMGVLKGYRGQGIGTSLLDSCLDAAKDYGLERVELEVFSQNTIAVELYENFGFELEGVKKRAKKLEGTYDDITCMALFLDDWESSNAGAP